MNPKYEFLAAEWPHPFRHRTQTLHYLHRHWHDPLEILLVLGGTATVTTGRGQSLLRRDDILVVNAGEFHALESWDGCDAVILHLDLRQLELSTSEREALFFHCNSSEEPGSMKYANLRTLVAQIVTADHKENDLFESRSLAYSLLKELNQNFTASKPAGWDALQKNLQYIQPAVSYIDQHYQETVSLTELSEAVHLTAPYLSASFTKHLGQTFSEYNGSVRLSHAVEDLLYTTIPIDAVASRNGFTSAQTFSRAFKAAAGENPSVFRRRHGDGAAVPGEIPAGVFRRYLPRNEVSSHVLPAQQHTKIVTRWNHITGSIPDSFQRMLGIGSAKQILLREVQLQLEEIQQRIGFSYLKFHGLFSDEMLVVSRDHSGRLHFSFRLIDKMIDYLLSIGLKPVLELGFMPLELAKDRSKQIYNNRFNTSEPNVPEDWLLLVRKFLEHILCRYGRELVASLPVLIWNIPDTGAAMFGMQDERAFFQMYRDTYRLIKEILPEIKVGAPALAIMDRPSAKWSERFYDFIQQENIVPDFFCAHFYNEVGNLFYDLKIDLTGSMPDYLERSSEQTDQFTPAAGMPMSADPNRMKKHLTMLKEFRDYAGLAQLPLWITEWNLTFSHRQLLSDTLFAGCYVVKNVLENMDTVEVMSYWSATDFIEEQRLDEQEFHGGLGLMTIEGIRKPQFLAFELLQRLEPQLLSQGDGYIVTRGQNTLTILLYNYEHFNEIYAGNKTYNMDERNRYTPFTMNNRRAFQLQLPGLEGRTVWEAVEFIVNQEHGVAYDQWIRMGAPAFGRDPMLDRYRIELLKASAYPLMRTIPLEIQNGSIDYTTTLEPLEFRLIQIKLTE